MLLQTHTPIHAGSQLPGVYRRHNHSRLYRDLQASYMRSHVCSTAISTATSNYHKSVTCEPSRSSLTTTIVKERPQPLDSKRTVAMALTHNLQSMVLRRRRPVEAPGPGFTRFFSTAGGWDDLNNITPMWTSFNNLVNNGHTLVCEPRLAHMMID